MSGLLEKDFKTSTFQQKYLGKTPGEELSSLGFRMVQKYTVVEKKCHSNTVNQMVLTLISFILQIFEEPGELSAVYCARPVRIW